MYPQSLGENEKTNWAHEDSFSGAPFDLAAAFVHRRYSIGMHTHSFYELNIVFGGTGAHYIEKQVFPVRRGFVFVIPPHVRHGYFQERELDVFHLLLSCRFFDIYAEQLRSAPGFSALFSIEPLLRSSRPEEYFLKLTSEQFDGLMPLLNCLIEEQGEERGVVCNGLALALIGRLCRLYYPAVGSPAAQRDTARLLIRSMETMQSSFDRKLSIEMLARDAGMSRSSYIRAFNALFRQPPGDYLASCRLRRAKELLETTDDTVASIAAGCGYYDSSHLIRLFTRAEGVTPARYRLLRRRQEEA